MHQPDSFPPPIRPHPAKNKHTNRLLLTSTRPDNNKHTHPPTQRPRRPPPVPARRAPLRRDLRAVAQGRLDHQPVAREFALQPQRDVRNGGIGGGHFGGGPSFSNLSMPAARWGGVRGVVGCTYNMYLHTCGRVDGWMDGWVDGWIGLCVSESRMETKDERENEKGTTHHQ